jgi:GTP-sensing pleiotropic transcriptional regulator CodY
MRSQPPDLSVLTGRDCLITFAAMTLCCDSTVRDHEMGSRQGGGTAYITAKGVMRRTGLSRTAAEHALRRLATAGVAESAPDSTGWRTSAGTLTTPVPAGS